MKVYFRVILCVAITILVAEIMAENDPQENVDAPGSSDAKADCRDGCPGPGWLLWSGFCYKAIFNSGDGMVRSKAEELCQKEDNSGSHIVSIHSAAENSFALSVAQKAYAELPKSTTSDTKVWIGLNVELNDKKHITGFTWLDNPSEQLKEGSFGYLRNGEASADNEYSGNYPWFFVPKCMPKTVPRAEPDGSPPKADGALMYIDEKSGASGGEGRWDNLPCDFKDFVGGAVCKGKATIKRDSPHDDAHSTQKPPPRQDKEKKEPKAPTPPQENLEPVFDTIVV